MSWYSRFRLRQAARHIRNGGVVIYPTEGVFGLGCDPLNKAAVDKIFALKGRSSRKGLILIADSFPRIEPFIHLPDSAIGQRLRSSWPGPVTWIVPASPETPSWITGAHGRRLAVRVTDHPLSAALAKECAKPLVSTSANPSGKPPARTPISARKYFNRSEIYWLPGAIGSLEQPTPIYDALTQQRLR